MFISNKDKQYLFDKAKLTEALIKDVSLMTSKITLLEARIGELEKKPVKLKKPMTAAQKAKQRAYQKAYNERQKAKKLAEGNTNVSA